MHTHTLHDIPLHSDTLHYVTLHVSWTVASGRVTGKGTNKQTIQQTNKQTIKACHVTYALDFNMHSSCSGIDDPKKANKQTNKQTPRITAGPPERASQPPEPTVHQSSCE